MSVGAGSIKRAAKKASENGEERTQAAEEKKTKTAAQKEQKKASAARQGTEKKPEKQSETNMAEGTARAGEAARESSQIYGIGRQLPTYLL